MKFFKPEDCDFFTRELTDPSWRGQPCAISLDKANALYDAWLAKGKVVYGCEVNSPIRGATIWGEKNDSDDTHRALLVCVEPLEAEDSAEKILADWLEYGVSENNWNLNLKQRAKKLLAKKGEIKNG